MPGPAAHMGRPAPLITPCSGAYNFLLWVRPRGALTDIANPAGNLVRPLAKRAGLGQRQKLLFNFTVSNLLDVPAEPFPGRRTRRVQHVVPVVVAPSRGSDVHHHSCPPNCRKPVNAGRP